MDYKQAHEQQIAFVEANIPEVFNEVHLRKAQQKLAIGMMIGYVNGVVDTDEIKAMRKSIELEGLNLRTKIAFLMLRYCPWLMKYVYPIYRPLRVFVCNVLGR